MQVFDHEASSTPPVMNTGLGKAGQKTLILLPGPPFAQGQSHRKVKRFVVAVNEPSGAMDIRYT